MENKTTISRVARKVVDTVKPAKKTDEDKAPETTKAETVLAPTPVVANPMAEMPAPVESKKRYNYFKNPQGKWELQLNSRSGSVSRTVYNTEADGKEVIVMLGLDKK